MEDKLLVQITLIGLLPECKSMVMVLDSSGAVLTTDLIKAKLLQEEVKVQSNTMDVIFTVNRDQNKFNKNKFHKKVVVCHGWDAKSHTK